MLTKLFCFRLNTAGVIIAWIGIVGSLFTTIILGICLGNIDELVKAMVKSWNDPDITEAEIRPYAIIVLSIYLALTVLQMLASGMLLIGTNKERHLWLLPWLFNNAISLAVGFIYNLSLWIMFLSKHMSFLSVLPSIILYFLSTAFSVYIFYGIYSLYKQIQATREEQRPLISNQDQVHHINPNYTST
ncbi:uncharacterized protein Dwil_GK20699 [Drosophila willistoni]|uniref:Uncharacterized protein n=1 Tax=Drosophila willistoni TaxID=7260 RepID=B4MK20_DROWI|nr:uncharacterized protein LOC6638443 [Drosophila willistoni]EDW72459.1 uncharacterized protein Dwil_GK20699 [Drosophila willistoni]